MQPTSSSPGPPSDRNAAEASSRPPPTPAPTNPAPTTPAPPNPAPPPAPEVVVLALDERLTHLALRGAFDASATRTIERLFTTLVPARRVSAMLDFRGVSFFSSYAMCMLVMASRSIRHRGRLLVLVAPTPAIEESLRATRLHLLMPFAVDEAEARACIERHEATGSVGYRPFTQS